MTLLLSLIGICPKVFAMITAYEKHEYKRFSCVKNFCQFRDFLLSFSIPLSHIMNVLITASERRQIERLRPAITR